MTSHLLLEYYVADEWSRRLDRKNVGRERELEMADEEVGAFIDAHIAWFRLRADAKNGTFPSRPVDAVQPITPGAA